MLTKHTTTVAIYDSRSEFPADIQAALLRAQQPPDNYGLPGQSLIMLFGSDLSEYASDISAEYLDACDTLTNLLLPFSEINNDRAVAIVHIPHANYYLVIDITKA